MLIGEFAKRSGLTPDTVRFYVRKGLLKPHVGGKGRQNLYQVFDERDAATVRLIRLARSLGMPLREVAEVAGELQRDGLTPAREIELLDAALAELARKAAEAAELAGYLRAKREWIAHGRAGEEPSFASGAACLTEVSDETPRRRQNAG